MAEAAMGTDFNFSMDFLYPGVDLSTVEVFHIMIRPVDFPGFWNRFFPTLTTLCDERLRRHTPLRRLSVFFGDLEQTWGWGDADEHWDHIYQYGEKVEACLRLYESALQPLRILAGHVNFCNLYLPYWIEFAEGMSELSRLLREDLNANINFIPIEDSKDRLQRYHENGIPVRCRLLGRIAEEEYERAQEGMSKRLADTGHWA